MPIDALATILLLVGLATIIYGPWQNYCTDAGRQTLFEIRDELFDMARVGKLSFRSQQYRIIRAAIEKNIRFAHNLTIWRFLIIYAHMIRYGAFEQKSELTLAIESISNVEVRQQVQMLSMRSTRTNIIMMVTKSPAFIVMLGGVFALSKLSKLFESTKKCFWPLAKPIAIAGEAIQIEAEAAACA